MATPTQAYKKWRTQGGASLSKSPRGRHKLTATPQTSTDARSSPPHSRAKMNVESVTQPSPNQHYNSQHKREAGNTTMANKNIQQRVQSFSKSPPRIRYQHPSTNLSHLKTSHLHTPSSVSDQQSPAQVSPSPGNTDANLNNFFSSELSWPSTQESQQPTGGGSSSPPVTSKNARSFWKSQESTSAVGSSTNLGPNATGNIASRATTSFLQSSKNNNTRTLNQHRLRPTTPNSLRNNQRNGNSAMSDFGTPKGLSPSNNLFANANGENNNNHTNNNTDPKPPGKGNTTNIVSPHAMELNRSRSKSAPKPRKHDPVSPISQRQSYMKQRAGGVGVGRGIHRTSKIQDKIKAAKKQFDTDVEKSTSSELNEEDDDDGLSFSTLTKDQDSRFLTNNDQERKEIHSHAVQNNNANKDESSLVVTLPTPNMNDSSTPQTIGDMQVQLDIAAAQILTEGMKSKDLRENFESEQQNWIERVAKLEEDLAKAERQREEEQGKYQAKTEKEIESIKAQAEKEMEEMQEEMEILVTNAEKEREQWKEERGTIEKDREDQYQQFLECEKEMIYFKDLAQKASDAASKREKNETAKELERKQIALKDIRKELSSISQDFIYVKDERDRLEKELEVVTEDRDELLRRSIAYQNQPPSSSSSPSTSTTKPSRTSPQHQECEEEAQRLRRILQQHEKSLQDKDNRISELEQMTEGPDSDFDLDLSTIDVIDADSHQTMESKEHLMKLQHENDKLSVELKKVKKERNDLKIYLDDAMLELEKYTDSADDDEGRQSPQTTRASTEKEQEERIKNLNEEIAQCNEEISKLKSELENRSRNNTSEDSLREDLNTVVKWLDSSFQSHDAPPTASAALEKKDEPNIPNELDLSHDDPALQLVYKHCKSMHTKLTSTQAELFYVKNELKKAKNLPDLNHSTHSLDAPGGTFDSLAVLASSDINPFQPESHNVTEELKSARDQETASQETIRGLQKTLQDTKLQLNIWKERVARSDADKAELISELSNLKEILNKDIDNSPGEDKSTLNYRIEIRQLRAKLTAAESELTQSRQAVQEFDSLTTPKKSNISRRRERDKSWRNAAQSSNEEEDRQSRSGDSDLIQAQENLKKKEIDEDVLKDMLQETSNNLNDMSLLNKKLSQQVDEHQKQINDVEVSKFSLEDKLVESEKERKKLSEKVERLESKLKRAVTNSGGFNDLSTELEATRADLERREASEAKLKKSLGEAVSMLNALRQHVMEEEKERKKLKRKLRSASMKGAPPPPQDIATPPPSPAKGSRKEDELTILQLRSHIITMEHEIRALEERIREMEAFHPTSASLPTDHEKMKKLEVDLSEVMEMLNNATETNKELLNDLKQTESEQVELLDEIDNLNERLREAERTIDYLGQQ